ncbi:M4 family metallopeptidase [Trichococcus sp. K1Tr]|uniref:M4 family metallopeptidase n=1 Tax=Trichococcus sp. K1Tr TaxID=3020847 RepID=UPI00232D6D11|nr:M4 family metallopeptidase [Trichococcus sp. K1Tr]MDB6354108.1 M4 family metallopeptidase [Trichococcus sp. K1Tr]
MKKRLVLGFALCMIIGLTSSFLYESAGHPSNEQRALSKVAGSETTFLQTKIDSIVESEGEEDSSESERVLAESIDPVKIGQAQIEQVTGNEAFAPGKQTGSIFLSGELSTPQLPGEEAAKTFLQEKKQAIGLADNTQLAVAEVRTDAINNTHVKFAQVVDGIKVENNSLSVHFDETGVITSVTGDLTDIQSIEKTASERIAENSAVEIAKKQYTYESLSETPTVEEVIITKDGKNYETYKVKISFMAPEIANYDVYVDAYSGNIIYSESNIRYANVMGSGLDVLNNIRVLNLYYDGSYYYMQDDTHRATNVIETYSMNGGTSSKTLVRATSNVFSSENNKAAVSAQYNAKRTIDFYKNLFDRNSLDDNYMNVVSSTQYSTKYNNAFWSGSQMIYGDGDGLNFTYLSGDLDVVGHEMTHGVIEYTADLSYHNESGALSESMADIFGVLISTYDKYNVESGGSWTFAAADWVIGDDIYTPYITGDALRSLANPALYNQPEKMSEYISSPDTESGDWGGIHSNSGILNKAGYLVAESIGMEKTAQIYYRALVQYMTEMTDFDQAKNYLVQAAIDLYGQDSAEMAAINSSFSAVGIGQVSVKPVTGISLDKKEASLYLDEMLDLKATVIPLEAINYQIVWSSSAPSIATVDDKGTVTAVGIGQAIITASVGDVTASITITVKESNLSISYSVHVQNIGWQEAVKDGQSAGTTEQSLRLEGIKINLFGDGSSLSDALSYRTHVQNYGWLDWVQNDGMSGTTDEAKRLEAIEINLTGEPAEQYDIYYRVHAQNFGWLDWAKNGASSGTAGYGYRLEAIEIRLVKKGESAPGPTATPFVEAFIDSTEKLTVSYTTHVQDYGWQSYVSDGVLSGTFGEAKRLEGIKIQLQNAPYPGSISYQTHVQDYGWQDWVSDNGFSGTSSEAKRLEAIRIKVTDEMAEYYDVNYRVHAQNFGWLNWAKNGEAAGTAGYAYRLEAIEIQLVPKGGNAPGTMGTAYAEKPETLATIPSTDSDAGINYVVVENKIMELLNGLRTENGLNTISENDTLKLAAANRAVEVASLFSHTRPDGSQWDTVLEGRPYVYDYKTIGENLAISTYSQGEEEMAAYIFDMWVNSSDYYANMINADYKEVGIGVHYNGGDIYAVQIFGTQLN